MPGMSKFMAPKAIPRNITAEALYGAAWTSATYLWGDDHLTSCLVSVGETVIHLGTSRYGDRTQVILGMETPLPSCLHSELNVASRHPLSKSSIWALSRRLKTRVTLLDDHAGGGPQMSEETIQNDSWRLRDPDQGKRVTNCRWFQTCLWENPRHSGLHLVPGRGLVSPVRIRKLPKFSYVGNPNAIREEPFHSEKIGIRRGMSQWRIVMALRIPLLELLSRRSHSAEGRMKDRALVSSILQHIPITDTNTTKMLNFPKPRAGEKNDTNNKLLQHMTMNGAHWLPPSAHVVARNLCLPSTRSRHGAELLSTVTYSSPTASLVLTDSSLLTFDSQHLGIYLNVDCQKSSGSAQRYVIWSGNLLKLSDVSCQSAPKKPRGYCTNISLYKRRISSRLMKAKGKTSLISMGSNPLFPIGETVAGHQLQTHICVVIVSDRHNRYGLNIGSYDVTKSRTGGYSKSFRTVLMMNTKNGTGNTW
uniref:Uncharacterized protein n=1 Tax=Timema douglasi TaxID=61478 RepID=A0A7R8VN41_TIMDO|nr:unnamed protein product [Timema douglasi]